MDYIQLGSGSSARLYMVLSDADTNGSGQVTLDIWPNLRSAPSNNDPITVVNPEGVFRLANNPSWTVGEAMNFGVSFVAMEVVQP
jgi:hypothetical protein